MKLIDIKLPKLGESVAEATVLTWLKKPGDVVAKDEMIAEVATDKVDTDLPSEYAGILQAVLVKEGETVAVGAVIARINVESAQLELVEEIATSAVAEVTKEKATKVTENGAPKTKHGKARQLQAESPTFLTPVVRNIAAEAGLSPKDLLKIQPTGSNNARITKKDILNYLTPKKESVTLPTTQKLNLEIAENDEVVQLSRMRKLIGQHMTNAVQTVPHVTTFVRADVTELVRWRDRNKEKVLKQENVKLTYTHIIMQCVVEALRAYPKLNAWMNASDELIIKQAVNLGFAAATPDDNLIVPNLKNAQDFSLYGLAKRVNQLGKAAKEKALQASDIENTTFTVSNTGIFGSLMGTPILSPPQVGVLALGAIESAPGVIVENREEKLAIRKQMYLSISYDHRIIDGAYASQFLQAVKVGLEKKYDLE